MSANKKLLVLPGDGVGPEVMREVINVIDWMDRKRRASFDIDEDLVGGASIDARGVAITPETVARAKAYEAAGVDALFFTGLKTRGELQAISSATKLPIIMGSADGELADMTFLASQRVRVANQGHAPIAAATQAVYQTLKELRDGTAPKSLRGLPSSELTNRVMRDADVKARIADFLGLKQ